MESFHAVFGGKFRAFIVFRKAAVVTQFEMVTMFLNANEVVGDIGI